MKNSIINCWLKNFSKKALLFLAGIAYLQLTYANDPEAILKEMIQQASNVKTIRYNAIMNERINGKMVEKKSSFKINVSPLKIYVRQSFIGIKLDALYSEGWNNNQLLIATAGFPWIQTSLDPLGKRVRDNHHHTIFEAGFSYFTGVISDILNKHQNHIKIEYAGTEPKNNKVCYKIVISVEKFRFSPYTVKENESLTIISKRLNLSDFMLLERNPGIKYFNTVKEGQIIQIPNAYGNKLILYLDPELMLPLQIDIFDDLGLYGSYFYNDLVINKPFAWDEFNATYKEYGFR